MDSIYFDFLGMKNLEDVIEEFHNTLVDTNRSYKFFVNWDKVKKHVNKYKIEFNILNTLIGNKQFDDDLRKILSSYPQVLPTIPILLAIREQKLTVIDDFNDENFSIVHYDFNKKTLTNTDIDDMVEFFEKTGLKRFFLELSSKSVQDYVLGVEVGMDTNARKNRSGDAMELMLKPMIEKIASKGKNSFDILFQKKFQYLDDNYNIRVNSSIKNRKADFIIIKNGNKVINIEVNFYSGTGSKPQEIVDSYIERQNELKENGFEFIWITDGIGWKGQKNQLHKGFERVNYLLNLYFVRKGLLEEILWRI
ncbi:type II restriction endonuclease [Thermoanaerobacterium sp. CMT5567-10]|uniref:type II restriction endonuclease n=1 Tax=Thermoanaerobacterium sp. CMT5567-10 TaxID=3061989 RepID=UPI0026E0A3E3|nr:type II restriction endonuclease [Thermoanaerobacterium sp. CMT5567-10]WKV09556.1 type II restriction endonuclease [Thermoanaerobacterium sp. CMT5567-10]